MSKRDLENYITEHINEIVKVYANTMTESLNRFCIKELLKKYELISFLAEFEDYDVVDCYVRLGAKEEVPRDED